MTESAELPEAQRPRLTREQVLASSGDVYNPFSVALWIIGVIAAIAAVVLYIVGLTPSSSGIGTSTSDLLDESAAKGAAIGAAGTALIVAAVFVSVALALSALRWKPKA
ncbi:hypothetical protein HP467_07155 [Curtobacterium albidum]|uniref:Uncharacterized protein n=1 Tax=Curtobacterium citreum TaxID=2036 RepID=A0A850DTA5_9MICO|nr:hypothetical protein [Curtobacterium albidum]NUU27889.1 hypothetical protein [Curtobacterium albidum]